MIDPPTHEPGTTERKTGYFVVQVLMEEAHAVGLQRVEFLMAGMDAATSTSRATI